MTEQSGNESVGKGAVAHITPAFDSRGLVPAIAQDAATGRVLMMAWMNLDAWQRTLETGDAWYFSRSRNTLWRKGESSGHTQRVCDVRLDCDRDTVLLQVVQTGPACHTGEATCFFAGGESDEVLAALPTGTLSRLQRVLFSRKAASPDKSYTARLFAGGASAIGQKLEEESAELVAALEGESDERVVSECADLLYFALVGLTSRGISVDSVFSELNRRFGVSGLVEKAARSSSG